MSERPALGTSEWMENNPSRFAILNANYDENMTQMPDDMLESEPWQVVRGGELLEQTESYEQAAAFLRNKLQEVS